MMTELVAKIILKVIGLGTVLKDLHYIILFNKISTRLIYVNYEVETI